MSTFVAPHKMLNSLGKAPVSRIFDRFLPIKVLNYHLTRIPA